MTLVNSGTINANQSAGMTINANGGMTNTGTMEATAGATLVLQSTTVTNTGGTISPTADAAGEQFDDQRRDGDADRSVDLAVEHRNIHGGNALTNSATGTIEYLRQASTRWGGRSTIRRAGCLKIDNGALLQLESGHLLAAWGRAGELDGELQRSWMLPGRMSP